MRLTAQLTVQAGPDKGRAINVPPGGIRLGRSSDNDVALSDPILSRHHCRLDYSDTGELRVTDLDSANETLVNGKPVKECLLKIGDQILIGDTRMVVATLASADAGTSAVPAVPPASSDPAEPPVYVDLGFNEPEGGAVRSPSMRPLLWAIGAAALLLLGAALIMRAPEPAPAPATRALPASNLLPLEIHYEKIEATTNSIFRYDMTLTASLSLAITIDDLAENRHVREETTVATNLVRELARELDRSGFFSLSDTYEGVARDDLLNSWEITVLQGRRIKRCRVFNRVEPEIFQMIRERIETFGKNELGIWAIQFSRDKLVSLAAEAFTRACNKFDERGIAYGNTADAIQRFKEAAFYLQTIDPKPDFHGELISMLAQAEEELTRRYEEQRFITDRALNLKEWATAGRELRILREMIPDRADPRNIEATRKLLDVESRLKTKGKP
jgi:hypothetical protein